jgi:hypothetical protein
VTRRRRELVRALATESSDGLHAWLQAYRLQQEDLVWLHRQGLVMLGFYRVQQAGLVDRLPPEIATAWQDIFHQATVTSATLDWQIERVLTALAEADVDFIWLKGAALAYTVYPNPICRGRGDLDLWVQVEQLPAATTVLEGLGYRTRHKADRPNALALLIGGEQRLVGESPSLDLIELQWPAIRGEWARTTAAVDHAGIWQRRRPVLLDGLSVSTMAPEDALIHLCLHQAINHQFSMPWLRSLLDVHLLIARYRIDWAEVVTRAEQWRLSTVLWTVLSLARDLLDTRLPESVLSSLAPARWRRWLIGRLNLGDALLDMRPGGYGYRRFLIELALVDRPRDGARLLWHGLYPDKTWLLARYAAEPPRPLWRLRLSHVWRLATTARL